MTIKNQVELCIFLKIQKVITGIRHITLEEAILPRLCCALRMGRCFPTFRRNLSSSFSRSRSNHEVRTLKLKAVGYFATSGSSQTHGTTTCFRDRQTGLQLIISFSAASFPVGKAVTLPLHQPHLSLLYSFSIFCFTKDRKVSSYYRRFPYI